MNASDPSEERIERTARAMFELRPAYQDSTGVSRWTWEKLSPESQSFHRANARDAEIATLRAKSDEWKLELSALVEDIENDSREWFGEALPTTPRECVAELVKAAVSGARAATNLGEAKHEIATLRAQVAEAERWRERYRQEALDVNQEWQNAIDRALPREAEIGRLRAALEKIANGREVQRDGHTEIEDVEDASEIARVALAAIKQAAPRPSGNLTP